MISRTFIKTAVSLSEHFMVPNTGRCCVRIGSRLTTAALNTDTSSEPTKNQPDTELLDQLAHKDKVLGEQQTLINDIRDKYQRSLAENENVLQRGRKQVEEARLFGIQGFSKDLLDVADVLEKATESVPKEELDKNIHLKNLFDGLILTDLQLKKVFSKNGLEKVNPVGERFDPHSHEAVFQVEVPEKEDGTVALVQKIGYKLNGRTLRPAIVGVVKKRPV